MLFDLRIYTCFPGTLKKHLALYKEMGAGPQKRCLGEPFLYAVTETPNPNKYVHIWAYKDAGDREAKRAKLWSDPEWLAYAAKSAEAGWLIEQTNTLLHATDLAKLPEIV